MKAQSNPNHILILLRLTTLASFLMCHQSDGQTPGTIVGVVVYTSGADYPDRLATASKCRAIEEFSTVVNIKTDEFKEKRLFRKQIKAIIMFRDLDKMTINNSKAYREFREEIGGIAQFSERFPRFAPLWKPYEVAARGVLSKVESGNALVNGQWMTIEELKKKNAPKDIIPGTLTFDGREYSNIRLTSVAGTNANIIHSSGAVGLPLSELSLDNVEYLNSGAGGSSIELARWKIALLKESKTPAFRPLFPVSGNLSVLSDFEEKIRLAAAEEATALRERADELRKKREIDEAQVEMLLEKIGTNRRFWVLQKLTGWSFQPLREAFGELVYEVRFSDGELGIVACTDTRFLTTGWASMNLVPIDVATVTMKNGFDRNTLIFEEVDPEVISRLRREAADTIDLMAQIHQLEDQAKAIERQAEEDVAAMGELFSFFAQASTRAVVRVDSQSDGPLGEISIVDPLVEKLRRSFQQGDVDELFSLLGLSIGKDTNEGTDEETKEINEKSDEDTIEASAGASSIKEFLEKLRTLPIAVSIIPRDSLQGIFMICEESVEGDSTVHSLASLENWTATQKVSLVAGREKNLKIPIFQNEIFFFSLFPEKGPTTHELLLQMKDLAAGETELDIPHEKVIAFLRERAPKEKSLSMAPVDTTLEIPQGER